VRTSLFWIIMQQGMVITYRHFGTTYLSHLPLKMGPIGCSETSVSNHYHSLYNGPEERTSRLLRGGSLKAQSIFSTSNLWSNFYGRVCDLMTWMPATRISDAVKCMIIIVTVLLFCLYIYVVLFVIHVVLLLIVMFYVLFMCKCVLPPGVNPIAVDKYININNRNILGLLVTQRYKIPISILLLYKLDKFHVQYVRT
jgi:hypothetical protein